MSQFMEQVQAEYTNDTIEEITVFNESEHPNATLLLRKTFETILKSLS